MQSGIFRTDCFFLPIADTQYFLGKNPGVFQNTGIFLILFFLFFIPSLRP